MALGEEIIHQILEVICIWLDRQNSRSILEVYRYAF